MASGRVFSNPRETNGIWAGPTSSAILTASSALLLLPFNRNRFDIEILADVRLWKSINRTRDADLSFLVIAVMAPEGNG